MKVSREEFEKLMEICQAAEILSKDDLISCLVSWISDGLKSEEDELFGLMVELLERIEKNLNTEGS